MDMMEIPSFPGQAGPSRTRRPPPPPPPQLNDVDLADRINALQRKQAAQGHPVPRPRRPASPAVDEYTRSPRQSSSKLFDPKLDVPYSNALPKSPRQPTTCRPQPQSQPQSQQGDYHRGQRVHSPGPAARRDPRASEYSRGPAPEASHRALFDPSQPGPSSGTGTGSGSSRHHQHNPNPRLEPALPPRESRTRRPDVSRPLFDPSQHDPVQVHGRMDAPSLSGSGHASSRSFPRVNGRSKEEEADRERERRKRKEGSERGMAKKKESDSKSKGSRSSEGSESFKDRERGKGRSDGGVKAFLKDVYDRIKILELELNDTHRAMANSPTASVSRDADLTTKKDDKVDTTAWLELISKHKKLADLHHEFLVRVFDPLVPSSLHQLTVRYNIPSRLWQSGFHLILERLRHAWMSHQPAALDLLTDLVYDAYKFYTDLLEDQTLVNFRTAWIEALGDLARYRMAIASHQANESISKPSKSKAVSDRPLDEDEAGSSAASIGAEVAQHWDVEDKETWRTTARDWYSMGITEKPGEGRLHHHLALLARDIRGQEPRALHHFTKSLTVTHAFESARESILPLFDSGLQSQRSLPEATAMDLFIRLHGMLFTRIQLDDLPTVMSRFLERLEEDASLDGVSRKATITQVDWMLMATTNITALLQYGSGLGIIRKALAQEGAERRRQHASVPGEDDEEEGRISGESDGHQAPTLESPLEPTLSFSSALELSYAILGHCLQHPRRMQGMTHVLNPYITLSLTFIATLFRQSHVGFLISTGLPWVQLVDFLNTSPDEIREEARLINGAPLPEDWCIRGMEWVGRRVYERGFWKSKGSGRGSGAMAQPKLGERFSSEMDVLLANFDAAVDSNEGVVDEIDGTDLTDGPVAVNQRRWRRVSWVAGVLVKHVQGLDLVEGKVVIRGVLADKLAELEAERLAKESPPPVIRRLPESLDEPAALDTDSEDDDPDLAVLRERRRHLSSLVNTTIPGTASKSSRAQKQNQHRSNSRLRVVPGYTMLVFDTNVLLSSLSLFSKLVESGIWSIVIPLPVVTELDGLSKEPAPLGPTAKAAVSYLEQRIRTHSLCLKIQTTKGNYLSDLLIRTEHHERTVDERTMDDRILNIAAFQNDHFVDRSSILGARGGGGEATKVVLVTFDRNLRLKARARGVDAADEKEMAGIMGKA